LLLVPLASLCPKESIPRSSNRLSQHRPPDCPATRRLTTRRDGGSRIGIRLGPRHEGDRRVEDGLENRADLGLFQRPRTHPEELREHRLLARTIAPLHPVRLLEPGNLSDELGP